MKIAVAGTGYVGLVTAVCLAEKGHSVWCVDVDEKKIEMLNGGKSPIYEKDLEGLMAKNKERLCYTLDYKSAYSSADVIFVGVGTPEKKDGSANLDYVYSVIDSISQTAKDGAVVVIKSTVPIGTNDNIEKILNNKCPNGVKLHVASNPEFLSQGTAVYDTLFASRVVIGAEDEYTKAVMKEVYKDFDCPVLCVGRRSAEMIKYASNNFLALKISYINEIANLCEIIGADIEDVALGMGYDTRIGNKFLKAGIGYGGSCFPKDTKALHWLADFNDCELKTVKATIEVNEKQKLKLIKKSRKYYKSLEGLNVCVLGLAFKPGTDDLREAPTLVNIPLMLSEGAKIKAWDPIAKDNFKKLYPNEITYAQSIEDALDGADICFIFTEWKEIIDLNPCIFKEKMKNPIVLDGRNCFEKDAGEKHGFTYESIGR